MSEAFRQTGFVDTGLVDNFIAEQENKATLQKPQRDVQGLQALLETKNEIRKVEDIPATKLNEYLSDFSLHRLILCHDCLKEISVLSK